MSKVEFALFSPQAGQSTKALFERAALCEKLAYHSIWLVDHFWTRGMPDLDHVEALTMMAGLAARTEKIRIGTLVGAKPAKGLTAANYISQILPHGFESFSLTFWKEIGVVNLKQLAEEVRPALGGQAIISSPQMSRSVIMSVRPAACRRKFID